MINTVTNIKGKGEEVFKLARENARKTGKLLGHFLALNPQFDSYSVSLMGFSLGSQVIKSCLNTIAKLGLLGKTCISNVYFLGGATYIREEKVKAQKATFAKVVNGRICNVFTNRDSTLLDLFEPLY